MFASHKKPSLASPHTDGSVKELLKCVTTSLEDGKAIDPVVIDLKGKSSVADFLVITSATSQRHGTALADQLAQKVKQKFSSPRAEGLPQADWILLDCGPVIVHIFRPEVREFYGLEKMWSVDLDEGREKGRREG